MAHQIERCLAGEQLQRKKVYVTVDTRIKNLVNDYQNRNILDYLRGIIHNLKT